MQCEDVVVPSGNGGNAFTCNLKVYKPTCRLPPFVPVVVAVHDIGMSADMFAPLEPDMAVADPANATAKMRAMMPPARQHPMSRAPNSPPRFIEELFLVTYDQRGHGSAAARSPNSPEDVTFETLSDDCARVLEHVQAKLFPHHQIFLLAQGAGAAVAMRAATQVNRETAKLIRGVVLLRDWLDDASSFEILSHFSARPPTVSSVDAAVAWYVEQNVLQRRSRDAAIEAVAPLLQASGDGSGLEWVSTPQRMPALTSLITDSTAALRASAIAATLPCVVALAGADATAETTLASLNTNIRTARIESTCPSTYYPSIDSAHQVVNVVRQLVTEVNRNEDDEKPGDPYRPMMMMLPRP